MPTPLALATRADYDPNGVTLYLDDYSRTNYTRTANNIIASVDTSSIPTSKGVLITQDVMARAHHNTSETLSYFFYDQDGNEFFRTQSAISDKIGGDLVLVRLNAPLPAQFKPWRIVPHDLADYCDGERLFMYRYDVITGGGVTPSMALGDFDPAQANQAVAQQKEIGTDHPHWMGDGNGGDSSGAMFIVVDGEPLLVATTWTVPLYGTTVSALQYRDAIEAFAPEVQFADFKNTIYDTDPDPETLLTVESRAAYDPTKSNQLYTSTDPNVRNLDSITPGLSLAGSPLIAPDIIAGPEHVYRNIDVTTRSFGFYDVDGNYETRMGLAKSGKIGSDLQLIRLASPFPASFKPWRIAPHDLADYCNGERLYMYRTDRIAEVGGIDYRVSVGDFDPADTNRSLFNMDEIGVNHPHWQTADVGDSGQPCFIIVDDEPLIVGTLYTSAAQGSTLSNLAHRSAILAFAPDVQFADFANTIYDPNLEESNDSEDSSDSEDQTEDSVLMGGATINFPVFYVQGAFDFEANTPTVDHFPEIEPGDIQIRFGESEYRDLSILPDTLTKTITLTGAENVPGAELRFKDQDRQWATTGMVYPFPPQGDVLFTKTLRFKSKDGKPFESAKVWLTTDKCGNDFVGVPAYTNAVGEVEFEMVENNTYYAWLSHPETIERGPEIFVARP